MIERGMPMEEDTAKTMYECLLCGACTNDCATGYDPLIYIREGRTQALVNGVAPDYVKEAINRIAGKRQSLWREGMQGASCGHAGKGGNAGMAG